MRVHVVARGVRHGLSHRLIRRAARTAMRAIQAPPRAEVEVALVSNAAIERLNRRFLGHRGATDVLTFPGGRQERDRTLGEVVISVDRARRQARLVGWSLAREVALLVTHGVLHLGGYDDHTDRARRRMRRAEETVMATLSSRQGRLT